MDSFGTANDIPIVTAAIAYDDPILAQTFVLIIHQALYFGDQLFHNLISPFQCRLNEVTINERARVLTRQPTDDDHCILFDHAQVKIPLRLNGIVSYFPSRRPTLEEYHACRRLELTPDEPEWNPLDPMFQSHEHRMTGDDGNILRRETLPLTACNIMSVSTLPPRIILLDDNLLTNLVSHVHVSAIHSSRRANAVTPEQLSSRWNIGLRKAKQTLQVTTQRGTRTIAYPTLESRFRTNDRQLRYRRLKTALYTDTMFASTVSSRGNTCAQIFVNDLEWVRSFPLTRTGDAHTCLDLLFPKDGVPNFMIMDDAKELVAKHAIYGGALGTAMTDDESKESGDLGDSPHRTPTFESYANDDRGEEPTMPEGDSYTIDAFDKYIGTQLDLPLHDAMASATVVGRKIDTAGNPVGRSNTKLEYQPSPGYKGL
jgi:hypothetical protein